MAIVTLGSIAVALGLYIVLIKNGRGIATLYLRGYCGILAILLAQAFVEFYQALPSIDGKATASSYLAWFIAAFITGFIAKEVPANIKGFGFGVYFYLIFIAATFGLYGSFAISALTRRGGVFFTIHSIAAIFAIATVILGINRLLVSAFGAQLAVKGGALAPMVLPNNALALGIAESPTEKTMRLPASSNQRPLQIVQWDKITDMARALRKPTVLFTISLATITIISAALRLWHLGVDSQLFNQDEMTLGYDAWSVWQTGHDQHGAFLPIYFQTYGDYVPPIGNYLAAPFVGVFGLTIVATRLPFALLGIATVWFTGLLGRRWFGEIAGIIAAAFLAIDPWHLNYSRIAFPASTVPFFTVVALYTLTRAAALFVHPLATPRRTLQGILGWMLLSGCSFALLTGDYPTMKLEGPLLIFSCALAVIIPAVQHRQWRAVFVGIGGWLAAFLVIIAPFVYFQLINWTQVQGRFNSISVFSKADWKTVVIHQYFAHYNPWLYFWNGLKGGVAVHPSSVGELAWPELPLLVVGLVATYLLVRGLTPKLGLALPILITLWLLTFQISSSLTTDNVPHEIRTINLLPLPELLAGLGAAVTWQLVQRARFTRPVVATYTIGVVAFLVLVLVFAQQFLPYYFRTPDLQSQRPVSSYPYNIGMPEIFAAVQSHLNACDTVYVEPTNQTYMYILFTTKYAPAKMQAAALSGVYDQYPVRAGINGFPFVGQYYVGFPGALTPAPSPGLRDCTTAGNVYFVTHANSAEKTLLAANPDHWRVVATVTNAAHQPVWLELAYAN